MTQQIITTNPGDPWIPPIFGKQLEILNCRKRIVLVSGSRNSGKSIGVYHKIFLHLWHTPGASVAIIAKSKTLAKAGGAWDQITSTIADIWMASGMIGKTGKPIAFTTTSAEGTPGPTSESGTRTPLFKIRNWWGGESECVLLSVDHDHEVATKLKTKYFSMVYFMELSMFKDPKVLSTSLNCLRLQHLRTAGEVENPWFQWIADTNPDEDIGDRSWIYETFYTERTKTVWGRTDEEKADPELQRKKKIYYGSMALFEMFYWENPMISEQDTIELEMSCDGDPSLSDAWVKGLWGSAGKKRGLLFAGQFIRQHHVVGGNEGEGNQIDVQPESTTLYSGWDIGASVNHAAAALDRWPMVYKGLPVSGWSVLDEAVLIDEKVTTAEFGVQMWEKMVKIQNATGHPIAWKNWADASALDTWRASSGSMDYLEILAATKNAIVLQGYAKPRDSVRQRIRLLNKLLAQGRFFVSARCVNTIEMLEKAKAGDDPDKEPFSEGSIYKHIFDAITYVLIAESHYEMQQEASRPTASVPKTTGSFSVEL